MRQVFSIFVVYLLIFPVFADAALANNALFAQTPAGQSVNPAGTAAQPLPGGAQNTPGSQFPGKTLDPRALIETPVQSAAREAGNRTASGASQVGLGSGAQPPRAGGVPQVNEYVCKASELKENERRNIIDLLKSGFTGSEVAGQTSKEEDRGELKTDKLILTKPGDENVAVKATIPNQKFKPWEVSQFLNNYIDGPFALGIVLEDSLRTGRCETYSSPQCGLTGQNLKFRNSGSGILADLKPVKEAIPDFVPWLDGNKNLSQFSREENELLRAALKTEGADETQIKTAQRLEKQLMANSILTNFFEAKLETNCNNSACVISTYSLFDKYFNSWTSAEMVVSTFGPSLLFETKKLFGWTGRRGFLSGVKQGYQEFLDLARRNLYLSDKFLGSIKAKRIQTNVDKYGWRHWYKELTGGNFDGSGYHIVKTEEFQHWWGKQTDKGGFLEQIKTAEERANFLRVLKDMRSLTRAAEAKVKIKEREWQEAAKLAQREPDPFGPKHIIERQKHIEYGRDVAWWMTEFFDDTLDSDVPEWILRHPNTGFFNKGLLQVRSDGGGEVIDMFTEHRNMQRLLSKFEKDGSFKDFEKEAYRFNSAYQSSGDGLVLYAFDQSTETNKRALSYANIKAAEKSARRRQIWIKDDYGNYIPYNPSSTAFIQSRISTGAEVVEGRWKEAGVMSPHEFVDRITNARVRPNLDFAVKNVEQMINTVQEQNWVSRRYWNALDKLMAQEDELVRSYFTLKGGAKWTALPFGYWWAKKGFGVEGISQYQLPDTWHRLRFTIGPENIYDFAYIDFFANEGSDEGDIFVQMLNKLPWKLILDEVSDKYNPVKNLYNALTQNQLRSEAENLAFYMTGPEECTDCGMTLRTDDLTRFRPFFFVKDQKLVSYILEDTVSKEAQEKGQTLIMYSHRTNLDGQSGADRGEPINLVKALKDPDIKTCKEAVEELQFYGLDIGKLVPDKLKEKGRIGAVLAGFESITYGVFFWAGIFSTAAVQIAIAPQLHGCVDVDEGYYAHYFMPVKEKKDKQADSTQKSTEKVSNIVKKFKENFIDTFKGDQNSITKEAAEKIGTEIDRFVNNSKDNDIVQATLRLGGLSSGQFDSRELFYFWCGRGCDITPASYKQSGREEIRGTNADKVGLDFEKGQITRNGVPIVESPDNVRLASTNLGIPAIEIPHTVTETCLKNTSAKAFEINAQGEVRVLEPELLKCIQNGVVEQTGLTLETDKLNDAFGPLKAVVTTTHPNIKTLGGRIMAEGTPRKIAEGKSAKITIYGNKDVNLSSSNDGSTEVGKLESLQFENGAIIVKPNGCFLTWLKHHEDGILSKELVKGIRPSLERELNGQTQCQEPAINLELLPDQGSDFQKQRVDKFNKALGHQGPFTVFETPTQRFVISSEKNAEGICEDHLRVIDKQTGKVTDYTGTISQTPGGFKIKTNDGKEHEVKFSTKDGAPFVQLDANKPEVLTAAQGKNGAFYYDPDKGLWFAENAQLLPLIEAFREGIAAKVQPNGETTATASGNTLNVSVGKGENSLLNLPSLPESRILLIMFFALLVACFLVVQGRKKMAASEKPGPAEKP